MEKQATICMNHLKQATAVSSISYYFNRYISHSTIVMLEVISRFHTNSYRKFIKRKHYRYLSLKILFVHHHFIQWGRNQKFYYCIPSISYYIQIKIQILMDPCGGCRMLSVCYHKKQCNKHSFSYTKSIQI